MAITAILGTITNGKYEMAIMSPKKEYEAVNIVFLSAIIAGIFSIFLLVCVLIFKKSFALILEKPEIENWLFIIPFSVLFIGFYNALNFYNTREKYYKNVAISSIYKSTGSGVTQVGLGLFNVGPFGLILGQVVSYISGNYILLKRITRKYELKNTFDFGVIKTMAQKYKKFPLYTLPAGLLSAFNLNILSFLITSIFSLTILGYFVLAQRTIGVSSAIIGRSIGQVYFQKMSESKKNGESLLNVFNSTLKKLILIAVPLFSVLYLSVVPMFEVVFGKQWIIAGRYAQILIPFFALRFVCSSLSYTLHIVEKQERTFFIQALLILVTLSVFYYAFVKAIDFEITLHCYSIIMSVLYLFFIYIYKKSIREYSY